jgi:hypothetical protein
VTEDEKPPRWWPVAAMLAMIRVANAKEALLAGKPKQAVNALRPTMYCPCTSWGPCTAYYLKGYYQYCPNCGTYRAC